MSIDSPIIIKYTYDCPIEKVWEAISSEKELKTWYFPVENYQLIVGNEFTFYESCDSKEYLHRCKITRIIPQQLLEYTWEHPTHSKGSSILTWELTALGDKTILTLTHSGVESFNDAGASFAKANFEMGWNAIVGNQLRNYLYGIQKLKFEITIQAKAPIVWKIMWEKMTYTLWTKPFTDGCYYIGELKQGNRVHLLSPSGEGMYSDIVFYKENELIIFKHIGIMKDKKELPLDDNTKKWTGCFETYRLKENQGETTVYVEVDTINEYVEYMNRSFPLALEELKNLIS